MANAMRNEDFRVILGTAHLITTPGKRSPDGRLREAVYSREIVERVEKGLRALGFSVFVDYKPLEPDSKMQSNSWNVEQSRELQYRVDYVNGLCKQFGTANCVYVSIHNNAARKGDEWCTARGFSVFAYNNASLNSRRLAGILQKEAEQLGLKGNRWVPELGYWTANYKVLRETNCPAVLTECLFQDNREDVEYLLSEEGKAAIVAVHVRGILRYFGEVLK